MSVVADKPPIQDGTPTPSGTPEQRRFQRFGIKLPCRVKPHTKRKKVGVPELEVETQDVSRGGMFFLASADMAIGTAIDFELDLPASVLPTPARIRCRGTVTRVVPQPGGRVGIGATIDHYKISPITPPAT
jgi:PilZ domain